MAHLTASKVRAILKAGIYLDGDGLRLQVKKAGTKSWLFRYQLNGKTREMGLGSLRNVSLRQARFKAGQARQLLIQGIDPIAHKKANQHKTANANTWTFDRCAEEFIKAKSHEWTNEKHTEQWRATIRQFCSPVLGSLPVNQINTGLVMQVIEPIWYEKTETASRVRGRIENILSWATVRGYREGMNPALWRGHIEHLLPNKNKTTQPKHHPAMPYQDVGAFMDEIKHKVSISAKALQLTILTATRTSEVIGAKWDEINSQTGVWTIPAQRMKANREHRVPLSKQALNLLDNLPFKQDWLFPSVQDGKHISNMAMLKFLKRDMRHPTLTVHGFRSTFRDWCAEQTSYPRELAESALAHVLSDKTEAAYQRGDLLQRRQKLMQSWANYCTTVQVAAEIVTIGKVGKRSQHR